MILPFSPYAPDVADYQGASTKVATNVVPRADGYGPFKDQAVYTSALPAACRGYFYARKSDGSQFSSETIPRIKVEYQVSPPIFLRLVGQYAARSRSALRDRNGNPILVNAVLDTGEVTNEFSTDWLFSYRPVPGTLVYLGYGSTLDEPREFRFQNLRRTRDGFFGKISYLFRL